MHFFKFFIRYLFQAKTRQGLLLMAMSGLLISSFSLVIVQGVLKGLQGKRVLRSKQISGDYVIALRAKDNANLISYLQDQKIRYSTEYELEGLLRYSGYITPAIIHGVDDSIHGANFLNQRDLNGGILISPYMAQKVNVSPGYEVQIVSPTHTDSFFGDLPRSKTLTVMNYFDSKDPEMDEFHIWTSLRSVQSLVREMKINKIRLFMPLNNDQKKYLSSHSEFNLKSWEEINKNLVYALTLENNVIVLLFCATVALVGLSILSGLSIFYNRLKQDFVSFWILGMSIDRIKKVGAINVGIITIFSLILGNVLGVLFLQLLKKFSPVIMPAMFVDRSLPVHLSVYSFIYSFIFPVALTVLFTYLTSQRFFKDRANFVQVLRNIGR